MKDETSYLHPCDYETLAFDASLKLLDPSGQVAVFNRHQIVRALTDRFSLFVDRVWGDGVLLANYSARRVRILDGFPSRTKWFLLLQLPRLYRKGDIFEIITTRRIVGAGFAEPDSYWESSMPVPTDRLSITVVPPDGYVLADAQVAAPTVNNLDVRHHSRRPLQLRVRDPKLHIPYKLIWSLKRRTGPR